MFNRTVNTMACRDINQCIAQRRPSKYSFASYTLNMDWDLPISDSLIKPPLLSISLLNSIAEKKKKPETQIPSAKSPCATSPARSPPAPHRTTTTPWIKVLMIHGENTAAIY